MAAKNRLACNGLISLEHRQNMLSPPSIGDPLSHAKVLSARTTLESPLLITRPTALACLVTFRSDNKQNRTEQEVDP